MANASLYAVVILIIIVVLAAGWAGYVGTNVTVPVVGLGLIGMIVGSTIEPSKAPVAKVGGDETPQLGETDFEVALAARMKQKYKKRKSKSPKLHAHQEAVRDVIQAFTGVEFVELSGTLPLPKGKQPTKDVLPCLHKGSDDDPVYLDLDGYAKSLNLAFEYRGPVHDENPKVQNNDAVKEHIAAEHGVRLLIPHYGIPAELMSRYIYTKLVEWEVPLVHGLPKYSALSSERMRELDWHNARRKDLVRCLGEAKDATRAKDE